MEDNRTHYLIRIVYRPRLLIYALSSSMTATGMFYDGPSVPVAFFCLFLLVWPPLALLTFRRWFNGAGPARYSLMVDAVLTGLLILANDFYLLASVSFASALVMSTLVIAGPAILIVNAAIVAAIAAAGWTLAGVMPHGAGRPLTDVLSVLSLIGYHGLVGHIGFNESVALIRRRAAASRRQSRLEVMTDRLRRYISPQIYSRLIRNEPMPSRRRRLTVFFSDIEGFTHLMDSLPEETVTRLLNEYLNEMSAIALAYGGTVDKFMGDGVMVFFGDPVSAGPVEDAVACVGMAMAMRRRLATLRRKWSGALHIRIGIHSGYCTVGNFGSEHRMDYTIVGGTVNLASRLEGHAVADEILISRDTWLLVRRHIACTRRAAVRVKGIDKPVDVFSVTDGGVDARESAGGGVVRLLT